MESKCEICGIETKLEKHHLIPQSMSRSAKYSKKLKTDENNFLMVCHACHSRIHAQFTEQQLRDYYFTKDALLSDESFNSYVRWRAKHPCFEGSSRMGNAKKLKGR